MGNVTIEKIHRGQYLQEVTALCQEYHFASPYLIENIINWKNDPTIDDTVGFVLLDDGVVCGFAGCMKTLRNIRGKELVVNAASSAVVREEYRSYSLKLFLKIFSEGDIVLDLTPTDETYRFLMTPFFKCRQLDTAAIAFSRLRLPFAPRFRATTDISEILAVAPSAQKELLHDNYGYRGRLCTVFIDKDPLTVMCRVFSKAGIIKIADILYIDKPVLFAKHSKAVMAALCRKFHTLFCWCDLRFLPDLKIEGDLVERNHLFKHPLSTLFRSFIPIRRNSIYRIVTEKAEGVMPIELDALYSEKIMM